MGSRILQKQNAVPSILLILALLSVAITACVSQPGLTNELPQTEAPQARVGALDLPVEPDLDSLVKKAPLVIRGTVIGEAVANLNFGGRRLTPYTISNVRIDEVLKGQLEEEYITVGQMSSFEDTAVPTGRGAIFILSKVDHSVLKMPYPEESIPYDYFTVAGPQGKFVIENNRVSPGGPKWADTTIRFDAMPMEEFIAEVRESVARTTLAQISAQ